MTITAVHKRINDLLHEKGWSLYKLAEESKIPHSSLYTMMQRQTMPKLDTLDAICTGLGITLSDFFITFSDVTVNGYLTDKELVLLEYARPLPDRLYERIISYANGLYDGFKNENQDED